MHQIFTEVKLTCKIPKKTHKSHLTKSEKLLEKSQPLINNIFLYYLFCSLLKINIGEGGNGQIISTYKKHPLFT